MKWFVLSDLLFESIKLKLNNMMGLLFQLKKSHYFFLILYVLFYGFHCLWNWDEFMNLNRSLEQNAIHSGKEVSLWSLYPFQIVSVIFTAGLYFLLCVGMNALFSFGKKEKEIFRRNFGDLFRNLVRLFFLFVCVLFLGNQTLGFLVHTKFYAVVVVVFWTTLFLLFVIQNGKLYKQLFLTTDRSVLFISHSLGYINPILFVFFVLVLANV
ncbi:hypothetical protein EHQ68_00460 [Leptospira congkakensis]|uniref:DUF4271 domain-containing protein n=1 Tax=Leptospira congkakensis TaxID=2484932 RepID=A0A4Z1AHT8_9LEPT|nr:hypothetical protein [Leptospira congkakensis]TGL87867.1 hypothetical protein EHQ69_17395 [Leptospira congkakensis]TGL92644.1 hypothetical protein EHQ68_00460 [Leptospira congkakensis]TGL96017.1 hypothetical protein EHQ70_13065 [Leptospira congkakensis]